MNNITIPLVSIKNVFKEYKIGNTEIPVLRGINLDVYNGEWLSLLGASGSGKTTLLNLIGTLENVDKGDIFFKNINIVNLSCRKKNFIRRFYIGYIFQTYHLLPEFTVLENIIIPALFASKKTRKEINYKAESLLEIVGLKNRKDHKALELSGGEQQRVAIARSLINDPSLILADEPTGNLDSKTGEEILKLFIEMKKNTKKSIIMVTHNPDVAKLSDRVVKIKDGVIVSI